MKNNLSPKDIECLNGWPKGSTEYHHEEAALNALLDMCKKFGFGRLPQMASQIEELWREDKTSEDFEKQRQERFAEMGCQDEK